MSRQLQRLLPAAARRRQAVAWRLSSSSTTANQRDERDDAAKPRSFASRLKDVGVGFAANASRSKEEKQVNLAKGITGGLPDFVEEWTPDLFRKVGKGLGVAAVASWPLAFHHDLSLIHISEPTRPERISYAVFCLKKKRNYFNRRKKRIYSY